MRVGLNTYIKCIALVIAWLSIGTVSMAADKCNSPSTNELYDIKEVMYKDIKDYPENNNIVSPDNVLIIQAYKKYGYILVDIEYSCCFEGHVGIFKYENGIIKEIAYYSGYSENGRFDGYSKYMVRKYLKKSLARKYWSLLDCYKSELNSCPTKR